MTQKHVLITGGNSGIGLATAQQFHAQGDKVAIFGRNAKTLQQTAQQLPGLVTITGDVAELRDLDRLADTTAKHLRHVDVLVVNAGVANFKPITDATPAHYDQLFNINVRGAFFTIQKVLPLLKDNSSITLIGSAAARKGFVGTSVYSATKAALRSFARTLAAELAPRGIRVNNISPGPIDTPIFERMDLSPEAAAETKAGMAGSVPLGRMGQPDEIAGTVLFLAGPGSYITGTDLVVDGGLSQL